jgi:hypothetical protein
MRNASMQIPLTSCSRLRRVSFRGNTDGLYVCTNPRKAVGVATDFFTAAIPIVIVYRVQIPRQQKWAVYAILMIGFLYALATLAFLGNNLTLYSTAGTSIAKTVVINWTPKDYTWGNSPVGYWGALEHELGIFAGCLVTLRPLLQKMHSHFSSGTGSLESHELAPESAHSRKRTLSEDELLRLESSAQPMGLQIQKMTEVEVSLDAPLTKHSPDAHRREDAWV